MSFSFKLNPFIYINTTSVMWSPRGFFHLFARNKYNMWTPNVTSIANTYYPHDKFVFKLYKTDFYSLKFCDILGQNHHKPKLQADYFL